MSGVSLDAALRSPDSINVRWYERDEEKRKEERKHQSTELQNGPPRFNKGKGSAVWHQWPTVTQKDRKRHACQNQFLTVKGDYDYELLSIRKKDI